MVERKTVGTLLAEGGERISDHLELLAVMGRDFAESLDIEETLKRALARIAQYVDAEGGALFLLDEAGATLRCSACVGPVDISGLTLKSGEGIVGRCVENSVGERVRDVSEDANFDRTADEKSGFTTRSILCAPMTVQEQRIGAIELVNKQGGDGLFAATDLTLLQALSSSAALAILNARMAAALVEQERVRRELELAAEIQRSLLPERQEVGFPVHGVNHPARHVSGDFYDFFPLGDGRICFNLGDVSGKGMNAALLMAKTASLFRCLGKTVHEPGRLLSMINAEICETVTRGMFVTMVGGIYDPATGIVRLANAGHEPPLFFNADGSVTPVQAEAPPLGISPLLVEDGDFPETEIALDGGTFYVFTDGVTEGYLEDGSELEVEGLKGLIRDFAATDAAARLDAIIDRVDRGDRALRDDLTILVIEDATARRTREAEPTVGDAAVLGLEGERVASLRVPARADQLKNIRQTISDSAKSCGTSARVVLDLMLAVDEACQNIIRHAYADIPAGDIIVEFRRKDDQMIILLRDFAPPVDVSKVKPRDLDDVRPGGLGTHFIREIMDEVTFLPPLAEGGNVLKLVKRIV
jgi:phosphoserine phosphatase RsbU/P